MHDTVERCHRACCLCRACRRRRAAVAVAAAAAARLRHLFVARLHSPLSPSNLHCALVAAAAAVDVSKRSVMASAAAASAQRASGSTWRRHRGLQEAERRRGSTFLRVARPALLPKINGNPETSIQNPESRAQSPDVSPRAFAESALAVQMFLAGLQLFKMDPWILGSECWAFTHKLYT